MYWIWTSVILFLLFVFIYYIRRNHKEKLKSYKETFLCQMPKNELPMTKKQRNEDAQKLAHLVNQWENTGGQRYINAEPRGTPPLVSIYSYPSYNFHPKNGPQYHRYKDPFDKNFVHKTYAP